MLQDVFVDPPILRNNLQKYMKAAEVRVGIVCI